MSDLTVRNVICFTSTTNLVLLEGVLIDVRAHNFVHVKISLRARCAHARHRCVHVARNLSSPGAAKYC